jgi:ribosomal protein L1
VFAEDDEAEEARSAGADLVGAEELIDKVLQSKEVVPLVHEFPFVFIRCILLYRGSGNKWLCHGTENF